MASVIKVNREEDFHKAAQTDRLIVAHFEAPWAPQCQQMNDVIAELAKSPDLLNTIFIQIEAEAFPEISLKYNIAAVPTFIFLQKQSIVERLDGANVPELTKKVQALTKSNNVGAIKKTTPPASNAGESKESLNSYLKQLTNSAPCMLFMKGNPQQPKCGFSQQMIGILNKYDAEFKSFDILTDEKVRQGLKEYSNWPTYPQLYIKGELIGGIDIIKEMESGGELEAILPKKGSLEDRLKALIGKSTVMVFMKGNKQEPRCGFSKQLVAILNENGTDYETFDILEDEEVRQGLKTYSDWPTYPQLYVNGNLIGGLDIVKELRESGELKSSLQG